MIEPIATGHGMPPNSSAHRHRVVVPRRRERCSGRQPDPDRSPGADAPVKPAEPTPSSDDWYFRSQNAAYTYTIEDGKGTYFLPALINRCLSYRDREIRERGCRLQTRHAARAA
jgi:hypothetical protein